MESFHLQIAGWNCASSQLFKSCLSESCITEAPLPPRLPLWLFTLRFFRYGSQVHWQIGRAPRGNDIQIWQFSCITKKSWMGGGGKHWLSSDFELPVGFNYRAIPAPRPFVSPCHCTPVALMRHIWAATVCCQLSSWCTRSVSPWNLRYFSLGLPLVLGRQYTHRQ